VFLKLFVCCFIFWVSLGAKECSPYYNPERFYETNDEMNELIDNHISSKDLPFFGNGEKFEKLNFKKEKNYFISNDKHTIMKEYIYPISNGLWKYTTNNGKIDEMSIAQVELYRYKDAQIAYDINEMYGNFWADWTEDGYEMQLTPEQTLFRYNDTYFSFSVYIYGFKGDATALKGTVINYWFKDYTKHVNKYIKCMKEKNDS